MEVTLYHTEIPIAIREFQSRRGRRGQFRELEKSIVGDLLRTPRGGLRKQKPSPCRPGTSLSFDPDEAAGGDIAHLPVYGAYGLFERKNHLRTHFFRARAEKLHINGDGGRIRPREKVHAQIAEGKDAQDH